MMSGTTINGEAQIEEISKSRSGDEENVFLPTVVAAGLRNVIISQLVDEFVKSLVEDGVVQATHHLLCLQLNSVFNVIQWLSIEERENLKGNIPPDPYYPENYARWKEWLTMEAATMKRVSDCLDSFNLRSLLLSRCDVILRELEHTILAEARFDIFSKLAQRCLIPPTTIQFLLTQAQSGQDASTLLSFLPSETGLGFILRDRGGAAEEEMGIIQFECLTNDREPGKLIKLLTLKSIFSRQLPKMPREYLTRLTLDRQHYCLALLKQGKVIGGCCFRPFFANKFAEIVFLAVTSSEQVKGYGTRLMNHLKEFVRHRGIEYFLTYADNFALGYFRKQGFSSRISMPKDRWQGFIKDYDGGTLMECVIAPSIDYLALGKTFLDQRRHLHQAIRLLKPLRVYSGQALWQSCKPAPTAMRVVLDPKTIPGFAEAGWTEELNKPRKKEPQPLNDQVLHLVEVMLRNEASWPFRKPVSKQEAPDYHEHIKQPMDISTIRKNAKQKLYKTKAEVGAHLKLMFDNCRYYNMPASIYYKLADELEAAIWPKFEEIEENEK